MGLSRVCAGRFWALCGKGFGLRRGGFGEVVLGFGVGQVGFAEWCCGCFGSGDYARIWGIEFADEELFWAWVGRVLGLVGVGGISVCEQSENARTHTHTHTHTRARARRVHTVTDGHVWVRMGVLGRGNTLTR